jgi:hypothetical protein
VPRCCGAGGTDKRPGGAQLHPDTHVHQPLAGQRRIMLHDWPGLCKLGNGPLRNMPLGLPAWAVCRRRLRPVSRPLQCHVPCLPAGLCVRRLAAPAGVPAARIPAERQSELLPGGQPRLVRRRPPRHDRVRLPGRALLPAWSDDPLPGDPVPAVNATGRLPGHSARLLVQRNGRSGHVLHRHRAMPSHPLLPRKRIADARPARLRVPQLNALRLLPLRGRAHQNRRLQRHRGYHLR